MDDPWEEHIKFNPIDYFFKVMKGNKYISRVSNEFISIEQPEKEKINDPVDRNNRFECKICRSERISIVFLPWGHMIACGKCTTALTVP